MMILLQTIIQTNKIMHKMSKVKLNKKILLANKEIQSQKKTNSKNRLNKII